MSAIADQVLVAGSYTYPLARTEKLVSRPPTEYSLPLMKSAELSMMPLGYGAIVDHVGCCGGAPWTPARVRRGLLGRRGAGGGGSLRSKSSGAADEAGRLRAPPA